MSSSIPVDPSLKDPYDPNDSCTSSRSAADVLIIRTLYEQYFQSYQLAPGQHTPTNESRLSLALELAKAMLEYYFPASNGYSTRTASFNKLAQWGFPIQLDDPSEVATHVIPPSLIGGWYVDRKYEHADADPNGAVVSTVLPHTVFAVMIDDLATKPHWVVGKNALVIPGDIVGTNLGLECGIAKGQGILIMGPTIEFYKFNKGANIRRTTYIMRDYRLPSRDFSFTMDVANINEIDMVFRDLARMPVAYENGIIAN
ncbi:hypothetical protein AOQ84DRAFT_192717 [Glonium stellatum]|uniref:Uncharacterized protein n=1 Tax=Glonium stellatum TaxID=574774 RepID=A0A8E2F675_9PEZI|nr:hypothetical protein AOQ84DRAFT_192717 [Glonium stellatum]